MFCKNCGNEVEANKKYCPQCGNPIKNNASVACKFKKFRVEKDKNISSEIKKQYSKKGKINVKSVVLVCLIIVIVLGAFSYLGFNIAKKGKYCSSYKSQYFYNEKLIPQTSIEYNSDGQLLKQVNSQSDGTIITYDFVYDNFDRVSLITVSNGVSVNNFNIDYNKCGSNYIGKSTFEDRMSSDFVEEYEYVYDVNMNIISEKTITHNGTHVLENLYNQKGQTVEVRTTTGEVADKFVYTFDKFGKSSGYTQYQNEKIIEKRGPITKTSVYDIEDIHYDENGDIDTVFYTKIVHASSNSDRYVIYDENNNETGSYQIYTYDNKVSGNVLSIEYYSDNGDLYQSEHYEYKWKDFTDLQTWRDVLF